MVLNYALGNILEGNKPAFFHDLKKNRNIGFNKTNDDLEGLERLNKYIAILKNSTPPLPKNPITEEFKHWLLNFLYSIQNLGFLYSNPFYQDEFIGDEHESFVVNSVLLDKVSRDPKSVICILMRKSSRNNVTDLAESFGLKVLTTSSLLLNLKNLSIGPFNQHSPKHGQFQDKLLVQYFELFQSEYSTVIYFRTTPKFVFMKEMISERDISQIMFDALLKNAFFKDYVLPTPLGGSFSNI